MSDCETRPHGVAWRTGCPYMTFNNRFVVYKADPDGITHAHAARIPDGFLESLG